MTKKELYELARKRQKECQRAVFAAVDASLGRDVLAKLKHDLDEASKARRLAFEKYMNEE